MERSDKTLEQEPKKIFQDVRVWLLAVMVITLLMTLYAGFPK